MKVLPPGNILQILYLKERVRRNTWRTFFEIGAGQGYLSHALLRSSLTGAACDKNNEACLKNKELNGDYIDQGKYRLSTHDFTRLEDDATYDLVMAAMVIEHIPDEDLKGFMEKCTQRLNKDGRLVFFVPSSMNYWGIEDEVSGHIKRYEFEDFDDFRPRFSFEVCHLAGLSFPVSNIFFRLSNRLIRRAEASRLALSQPERTIHSGNRDVAYKTSFPAIFGIVLNEWVMYPFHVLQKVFKKNRSSMVIYCELAPIRK
jgi:SAM-dependent methyltransferase